MSIDTDMKTKLNTPVFHFVLESRYSFIVPTLLIYIPIKATVITQTNSNDTAILCPTSDPLDLTKYKKQIQSFVKCC